MVVVSGNARKTGFLDFIQVGTGGPWAAVMKSDMPTYPAILCPI
jgi:hypothetical protein